MYRHILIPTDGSELAEHGVAQGLALAKFLGAKVSVITVDERLGAWLSFAESGVTEAFAQYYTEQIKKHVASVLERAAKAAEEAGVSCETIQAENTQPHQGIIAAAEDKGCDLIVMSSHGRGGLSMLLIGSVTNKVLAHAKTPVLVCQ